MAALLADVSLLGLAVAFTSPVSVVTVIVLLSMPSGRRRALAFVCGWLIALAGLATLTILVLHGQDFSSKHTSPSRAVSALEVVLGLLLLTGAVVAYRRRRPSTAGASPPRWLDRVERTHWLLAVGVGAVMLSYALSIAAASEVLKANVSDADAGLAMLVFALTSIITVAAPLVVVLLAPERSEQRLSEWKAWLLTNSRAVVLVVLMVAGAFVFFRGLQGLVA